MAKKKGEIDKDVSYRFSQTGCNGTHIMEALLPWVPMPVCTVWFRGVGNSTHEILNSLTIIPERRKGYRTYLHNKMIEIYPKMKWIMTARGNKESTRWLKKMGFWQDEITSDWMLEVNRKKKGRK